VNVIRNVNGRAEQSAARESALAKRRNVRHRRASREVKWPALRGGADLGRSAHRARDESGIYDACWATLAIRRLSVIDVADGHQPYHHEKGHSTSCSTARSTAFWRLRERLEQAGHRFALDTDGEVIVDAYRSTEKASSRSWTDCSPLLSGMSARVGWSSPATGGARSRCSSPTTTKARRDLPPSSGRSRSTSGSSTGWLDCLRPTNKRGLIRKGLIGDAVTRDCDAPSSGSSQSTAMASSTRGGYGRF
jgi:hypothetical protein